MIKLIELFDVIFLVERIVEVRHPGTDQSAARTEPEDGGPSAGAVRHLHAVRAAVAARVAPQGEHVQEQASPRSRPRLHRSTVSISF